MKHLDMQTPDGNKLNLDALYKICPSCFTEAADEKGTLRRVVDWNKLRALLGGDVVEDAPEAYDFTWVGKRAAQREAAAPIKKTLRPCPEESVDWEHTQNLYIEGDNLEVLKLLQNSYMGKVKMIYIDPPYNTGSDFVYHDNRKLSGDDYDEAISNEEGKRYIKNTYSNGAFHSDWCSMMYSRLMVARSLLTDDGIIFISIDDNEIRNLLNICDEIFGESNIVGQWYWFKSATPPALSKKIKKNLEFVIAYQKGHNEDVFAGVKKSSSSNDPITKPQNSLKELTFKVGEINTKLPDGIYHKGTYGTSKFPNELLNDLIVKDGVNQNEVTFRNRFIWLQSTLEEQIKAGTRIELSKQLVISYKKAEYNREVPPSLIDIQVGVDTTENAGRYITDLFDGHKVFDYPKPVSLLKYLVNFYIKEDEEAIILDFFSGSASTAHAVMCLNAEDNGNRKYIMVQLPEKTDPESEAYKCGYRTICEVGKERIRRSSVEVVSQNPSVDTGFRVFKCDESNMKDVYFAPKDLTQDLLSGLEDNIKDDRTDLDLLFDCMLRWGVELSMPVATTQVGACTIHNVNDGDLVACFPSPRLAQDKLSSGQAQGTITDEVINAIAEMSPLRVVFRDSSFKEASQKMNLFELFKQKCNWSDVEVKNNVRVI